MTARVTAAVIKVWKLVIASLLWIFIFPKAEDFTRIASLYAEC